MKTKKINLKWQSVALGLVLCAALALFLVGKPSDTQQQVTNQQKSVINAVALNDLLEKNDLIEKKIVAMDHKLTRVEQKIDSMIVDLAELAKSLKKLRNDFDKK